MVGSRSPVELPSYAIIEVDPLTERQHEQMGTRPKFWFLLEGEKWLFKSGRPDTGEDWAEKIAAEVAAQLGLPHAEVELAEHKGERGSITLDFTGRSDLVHGNELLWEMDHSYPKSKFRKVTAHTVKNVLHVLANPRSRLLLRRRRALA